MNCNFPLNETVLPSGEGVANCIVQPQFKMDATSFYGAANIGRHGRNRGKLPNTSVDAVFASILNGDVSEAELSDDELGEEDHVASVAAVEDELTGEFSSASSDEEASENENEKPAPKKKKEAVTWKTGPFTPKDTYCSYMPHGGSTPAEPLVYFQQYFSDAVFEELTRYTNIYALQANGVELNCTKNEMKVFFGILMYMGVLKFPRGRMYWQAGTRIPAIADTMAVNRFFKLRSALHITDQNALRQEPCVDKFWKVRPLLDAIRDQCLKLEVLEHTSIDEQMVPFSGRVPAKQVIKSKPNPVGVKIFVRCSSDGLAHDFEVYQGKGTGIDRGYSYLGLGGWKDNNLVTMASTQIGVGQIEIVKRWSAAKKEYTDVECPQVIVEYNRHMGGVDKLDFVMSLYPIRAKTKKWPVRVISHLTSFALANSWLQYLRDASAEGLQRKETKDMLEFQTDVALSLIRSNRPSEKKKGRPSLESLQKSSVSDTIHEVAHAITVVGERKRWVAFPETVRAIPGVLGCVDGTLIAIQKPHGLTAADTANYMSRKGFYALNAMITCDADLWSLDVNPCFPGSCHGSWVWRRNPLRCDLEAELRPGECLLGH
ncbi:hypothetical protein MTO96_027313 [Rhipicephalus appendiculatus]